MSKRRQYRWTAMFLAIAAVLTLLFAGVKIGTVIYEKYFDPDRTSTPEEGEIRTLPVITAGPVTGADPGTLPSAEKTEAPATASTPREVVYDTEYTGSLRVEYTRMPGRTILTNADFNIETYISPYDANGDGIDDQTQFVMGAKEFLARNPQYKTNSYYRGGYPQTDAEGVIYGVCTDVIAFGMLAAGYDLKALIDADMEAHPENYMRVYENFDLNMNFRRVRNQYCFFLHHAEILTTDISDIEAWQPGDFVVTGDVAASQAHICMVSTRRAEDGVPYVLQLATTGQTLFEEDYLTTCQVNKPILAHFRYSGFNGE